MRLQPGMWPDMHTQVYEHDGSPYNAAGRVCRILKGIWNLWAVSTEYGNQ